MRRCDGICSGGHCVGSGAPMGSGASPAFYSNPASAPAKFSVSGHVKRNSRAMYTPGLYIIHIRTCPPRSGKRGPKPTARWWGGLTKFSPAMRPVFKTKPENVKESRYCSSNGGRLVWCRDARGSARVFMANARRGGGRRCWPRPPQVARLRRRPRCRQAGTVAVCLTLPRRFV